MKNKTIIEKLIAQSESYGLIGARNGIEQKLMHDIPRCSICGRPYIVVDIAGTDCFFVGCPNDAHRDGDIQIQTGEKNGVHYPGINLSIPHCHINAGNRYYHDIGDVIFMAIRLEDIEKSPLSKPIERANSIDEIKRLANGTQKTTIEPAKIVSPDIKITQTTRTTNQDTSIEIVSHDITDLKMILEDIGYKVNNSAIDRLREWYKNLRYR